MAPTSSHGPGGGINFAYICAGDAIAAGAALPAVGIILTLLRVYTRRLQRVSFGADDYCFGLALVGSTTFTSLGTTNNSQRPISLSARQITLMGMGGTLIYGPWEAIETTIGRL